MQGHPRWQGRLRWHTLFNLKKQTKKETVVASEAVEAIEAEELLDTVEVRGGGDGIKC